MQETTAATSHATGAPATAPDDATLVARIRSGDRTAFAMLYDRHKTPLFRTVLAVTRERAAADDLLQEAFLRAYRHIGRVRLEPGASLRPWLHRIAINLAYDWASRRKSQPGRLDGVAERLLAAPTLASPERQAERRELQRVVADAVATLPPRQQIVVVLFYLHEMDLPEIADTLDVPVGTVKSRLFYARKRLRGALEADTRLPAHVAMRYASA